MFIAAPTARSAKLRRSGMSSHSPGHCRWPVGARIPNNAAPTELARVSEAVVAINLKRAVQPRMDTDEHGFRESLAAGIIHPEGEPCK